MNDYRILELLNSISNTFYEDYKSFLSFSFFENYIQIRINTSTGFHWVRLYDYKSKCFYEEINYIFDEFEKQIVKFSLHIERVKK